MSGPMNSAMIQAQMGRHESIQKKLEMDALRKRLGDQRGRDEKLREAVEGFESIFVQKLWSQMRQTVPKEGYLHSREEEMWQSMFDEKLSQKLASAGGIGLGDMMYEQLQGRLNNASKSTGSTAVPPVRELSPRDKTTVVKPEAAPSEIADLYEPLNEAGDEMAEPLTGAGNGHDAMPAASVKRDAVPPKFGDDDVRVFTQLDELARKLEADHAAEQNAAQIASEVKADESTGMGGPEPRNPGMGMVNWPLPGRITSDFGWRNDPFTGKREWHAGVDIAGEVGDPVASCWDGKVVFAGEKDGYGNLVVLEHEGGWRSYYGHASKIDVKVGDEVASGKKIAEVGNTGRSTGPHLHFEMRQGELAWNPEQIRNRLMAGLDVGRQG